MYSIANSFFLYLQETAPSLFWQLPLDNLSFRWKIPEEECLGSWTGKSGVDTIKELRTGEVCGFAGIHFPGREFIEHYLVSKNPGPHTPTEVVDAMLRFYLDHSKDFGDADRSEFIAHFTGDIKHHAVLATKQGCLLRYATDETEEPVILTRQEFYKLFSPRTTH